MDILLMETFSLLLPHQKERRFFLSFLSKEWFGEVWIKLIDKCLNLLYLFTFCCAVSSSMYGLFSSCGEQGLLSGCGTQASHCSGFSCCRAQTLEHKLSSGGAQTLVALGHVESSGTRDQTHVSCTGRQILHHWATWEAQFVSLLFLLLTLIWWFHL